MPFRHGIKFIGNIGSIPKNIMFRKDYLYGTLALLNIHPLLQKSLLFAKADEDDWTSAANPNS